MRTSLVLVLSSLLFVACGPAPGPLDGSWQMLGSLTEAGKDQRLPMADQEINQLASDVKTFQLVVYGCEVSFRETSADHYELASTPQSCTATTSAPLSPGAVFKTGLAQAMVSMELKGLRSMVFQLDGTTDKGALRVTLAAVQR